MVYNIKKSEELFKLKLSVVCAHGIETHSALVLGPSILSNANVSDILHVQHQFFEIFVSVLGFSKGKIHFFPKVLKNWSTLLPNN